MALPKIDLPIYELTIPLTTKTIKVRPFTVKEEKLLLMAAEGGKLEEVTSTVKQVINNCVVDGKIDVDKLPFFVIDYMFIFLRTKSIGEQQKISLTCKNKPDGEHECNNVFSADLDMANIEILEDKTISNDIKLDGKKGVRMLVPNYSVIKRIEAANNDIDKKTSLIVSSIDYIYDEQGTYSAKDHSEKELKTFVEELTEENYKKMEKFVDNFPTFIVKLEATCTKCGFEHKVRYSDFEDFFT